MELYSEDVRYEFPFANDRPRMIESRKAFQAVMTPLWAEARQRGVPFIQLIRIRDDHIVEVREYFSPSGRQETMDQR